MDVSLVLTHACNLSCPYCYAGEKFKREMPRDVAEKALAFAERDDAERIQISFFGGEPFLSFDRMREYTELAREIPLHARRSVVQVERSPIEPHDEATLRGSRDGVLQARGHLRP